MTHQECIKASRNRKLVADDKFARHIKRASRRDMESIKSNFDRQTEHREENQLITFL